MVDSGSMAPIRHYSLPQSAPDRYPSHTLRDVEAIMQIGQKSHPTPESIELRYPLRLNPDTSPHSQAFEFEWCHPNLGYWRRLRGQLCTCIAIRTYTMRLP